MGPSADRSDQDVLPPWLISERERWLKNVRRGVFLLLAAGLMYGTADYLSILTMRSGPLFDLNLCLGILSLLGAWVGLVGVLSVTAALPFQAGRSESQWLRRLARILAVVFCLEVALGTAEFIPNGEVLGIVFEFILGGLCISVYFYLSGLANRFGQPRIAGVLVSAGCVLVAWIPLTDWLYPGVVSWGAPRWRVAWVGLLVGEGVVLVWSLGTLWFFGSRLRSVTEGRCLHCGYLLVGLSSDRCPECGARWGRPAK